MNLIKRVYRRLGRKLDLHPMNGQAHAHYLDLQALLLVETYVRILRQATGGNEIRAALVRTDPQFLGLTEPLADCGLRFSEGCFFEGDADDRFHPSRALESLDFDLFDLILIVENREHGEAQLLASVKEKLAQNRPGPSRRCPIIPLRRLLNAYLKAIDSCRSGEFATCLNAHKLATIAWGVYLAPRNGAILECGCYMGGTSILMGLLQEALGIVRPIYALDTFEGIPAPVHEDGATPYQEGLFSDNVASRVSRHVAKHGLSQQITLIKGRIQETLPLLPTAASRVSLAFIDTDQYSGTKAGLEYVVPRLERNGWIIVDDVTVGGVAKAISETVRGNSGLKRVGVTHNFELLFKNQDLNVLLS